MRNASSLQEKHQAISRRIAELDDVLEGIHRMRWARRDEEESTEEQAFMGFLERYGYGSPSSSSSMSSSSPTASLRDPRSNGSSPVLGDRPSRRTSTGRKVHHMWTPTLKRWKRKSGGYPNTNPSHLPMHIAYIHTLPDALLMGLLQRHVCEPSSSVKCRPNAPTRPHEGWEDALKRYQTLRLVCSRWNDAMEDDAMRASLASIKASIKASMAPSMRGPIASIAAQGEHAVDDGDARTMAMQHWWKRSPLVLPSAKGTFRVLTSAHARDHHHGLSSSSSIMVHAMFSAHMEDREHADTHHESNHHHHVGEDHPHGGVSGVGASMGAMVHHHGHSPSLVCVVAKEKLKGSPTAAYHVWDSQLRRVERQSRFAGTHLFGAAGNHSGVSRPHAIYAGLLYHTGSYTMKAARRVLDLHHKHPEPSGPREPLIALRHGGAQGPSQATAAPQCPNVLVVLRHPCDACRSPPQVLAAIHMRQWDKHTQITPLCIAVWTPPIIIDDGDECVQSSSPPSSSSSCLPGEPALMVSIRLNEDEGCVLWISLQNPSTSWGIVNVVEGKKQPLIHAMNAYAGCMWMASHFDLYVLNREMARDGKHRHEEEEDGDEESITSICMAKRVDVPSGWGSGVGKDEDGITALKGWRGMMMAASTRGMCAFNATHPYELKTTCLTSSNLWYSHYQGALKSHPSGETLSLRKDIEPECLGFSITSLSVCKGLLVGCVYAPAMALQHKKGMIHSSLRSSQPVDIPSNAQGCSGSAPSTPEKRRTLRSSLISSHPVEPHSMRAPKSSGNLSGAHSSAPSSQQHVESQPPVVVCFWRYRMGLIESVGQLQVRSPASSTTPMESPIRKIMFWEGWMLLHSMRQVCAFPWDWSDSIKSLPSTTESIQMDAGDSGESITQGDQRKTIRMVLCHAEEWGDGREAECLYVIDVRTMHQRVCGRILRRSMAELYDLHKSIKSELSKSASSAMPKFPGKKFINHRRGNGLAPTTMNKLRTYFIAMESQAEVCASSALRHFVERPDALLANIGPSRDGVKHIGTSPYNGVVQHARKEGKEGSGTASS